MLRRVDDAPGNIGAVVGRALETGEKIGEDEAELNAAPALLQTPDVARAHRFLELIDDLLERLDLGGDGAVVFLEASEGQIENFADRPGEHRKFGDGARRECEILVAQLLGGFERVDGVVGDALKIADGFQKSGGLFAFRSTHLLGAELYEIGAENVLVMVAQLLILPDPFSEIGGIVVDRGKGILERTHGVLGHVCGNGAAPGERQRRCCEQALVQLHALFLLAAVRHDPDGELFKQTPGGQEHGGAEKVEGRMGNGDAGAGRGLVEQRRGERCSHYGEHRKQDDNADDVEHQMHHGGAARVFVRADGGEKRRHGRADVLAHDDGDRCGVAHRAGGGERLQNADRSRARLDDAREHRTGHHAEQRVFERKEEINEHRVIAQPRYRAAHRLHAEHQRGKAEQDDAGILFAAAFAEKIKDDADHGEDRGKGGRLEEADEHARAVNVAETQKPRRHGRADVCAHNDADRLAQRHQSGVYKADDHNGRCGRALDHGGHAETGEKTGDGLSGHFVEKGAEFPSGAPFERLPHQTHAEEEQRQAAEHRKRVKNVHKLSFS